VSYSDSNQYKFDQANEIYLIEFIWLYAFQDLF